jgi:hypothetical protein
VRVHIRASTLVVQYATLEYVPRVLLQVVTTSGTLLSDALVCVHACTILLL